jgi:glycosyltransferase involved in cell wall biosynthesis
MTPDVTVIIPTYNRAPHLQRVLDALERQDVVRGTFDVFVVDDGSSDSTSDVLSSRYWFDLHSLRQENGGPASARNAAIEQATGEIILFVDDDVIPREDLVRRHLDAHRDAGPCVVIGRMLEPEGMRQPAWAEWESRTLRKQYDKIANGVFRPSPRQFFTANASVRREDIVRAGMFDARFRRAEDVELAYRLSDLGLAFQFEPEAVVLHDTPRTLEGWLRVAEQYGRYDIVMWRDGGRAHIIYNIAEEFCWHRRPAVRALTRVALGRRPLMAAIRAGSSFAIRMAETLRSRRAALGLCSGIFNLLYLDAAAREMGGRRAFWRAIDDYMAGRWEPEVSAAAQ